MTGESGSGTRFGDFEGRTAGTGPVLSYILPRGKETFVAELRWLPEMNVERRLEGDYVWLKPFISSDADTLPCVPRFN